MIKKRLFVGFSVVATLFVLVAPCNMVVYASDSITVENEEVSGENYGAMPYSDIIEYRYKVIGTNLYRRLYNYTEQCWVGDWELVSEGYIKPGM